MLSKSESGLIAGTLDGVSLGWDHSTCRQRPVDANLVLKRYRLPRKEKTRASLDSRGGRALEGTIVGERQCWEGRTKGVLYKPASVCTCTVVYLDLGQ